MMPRIRSCAGLAGFVLSAVFSAPPAAAQSIRISESVSELEARARRDSCDGIAWYNLGIGYLSRRQWSRADSALARAVTLEPSLAVAWLARSLVWERDNDYWKNLRRAGGDSAVRREWRLRTGFSRRAFLTDPLVDLRIMGSVITLEDHGEAIEYYFGRDSRRFSDGLRGGLEGLVEGNYEAAYTGFMTAAAMWNTAGIRANRQALPEWLVWYQALAAAHTNRNPEAVEAFSDLLGRTIDEEKKDSTRFTPLRTNEYRYMLALLRVRQQQPGMAVQLFQEVIENDIGNFMAHVQLARIFEGQRDWARAIDARRNAAQVNPEDHSVQFDLGAVYTRAGLWAEAEAALVRASEMEPRYPRTWYALGIVHQQLNKPREARESFNRFLAIAPQRLSTQVADARQRLGQLQ